MPSPTPRKSPVSAEKTGKRALNAYALPGWRFLTIRGEWNFEPRTTVEMMGESIGAGDEDRTRDAQLEILERETGIEPATPGLGSRCSTIELLALKTNGLRR